MAMSISIQRKLAAIMVTDIAEFSNLASIDEKYALNLLEIQRQKIKPIISQFNGTLHKEMGDGMLITFPIVSDSINCAIAIQKETKTIKDLNLRIGIHEGEIAVKGKDVLGDDINIAYRIEPFAASGGIAISGKVQQNISSLPEFETVYLGKPKLKGINKEIEVFCITSHGLPKTDISKVSAKIESEEYSFWTLYKKLSLIVLVLGIVIFQYTNFIGILFAKGSFRNTDSRQIEIYGTNHSKDIINALEAADSLYQLRTSQDNLEAIYILEEISLLDSTQGDFHALLGQLYFQKYKLSEKKSFLNLSQSHIQTAVKLDNINKIYLCKSYLTYSDILMESDNMIQAKQMLKKVKMIDFNYPGVKDRSQHITSKFLTQFGE